jgi:hypothetical protein
MSYLNEVRMLLEINEATLRIASDKQLEQHIDLLVKSLARQTRDRAAEIRKSEGWPHHDRRP